jgi:hypothetical protein
MPCVPAAILVLRFRHRAPAREVLVFARAIHASRRAHLVIGIEFPSPQSFIPRGKPSHGSA